MHIHQIFLVLLGRARVKALASTLIPAVPSSFDNTPGNVVNCNSRSEAIHNLTVYGTEILYTPVNATSNITTGTDATTSFEFQLYNSVLGVDAQCSTHVPQNESLLATWHTCFVESRDTRITAAFQFDLTRHTLIINETWVCDGDGDKENGGTFQAWATNNISVLCAETVNADLGQHYCASIPNVPLPVNVTRVASSGQ
ncbi:hypothetical protein SEUCBS139899_005733 [Sporothrix eucalyptigena]|uniref:AA1-like domain-containing protein n=1 Tax=Sporothrix eucalyptigena TaxID=1812306 RepID=A0ABP0D0R5_9PEZI